MMRTTGTSAARWWVLAGLAVGGCAAPPQYSQPVSGVSTEDSDHPMAEPVLVEFLDPMTADAAAYLAGALPNLPEVQAAKNQLVFTVPQTLKIDGMVPDSRIEQSLVSMRTQLQQNKAFSDDFVVLSATEVSADGTLKKLQSDDPAFRDALQRTADQTKVTKYNPSDIYALSARMYMNNDPGSAVKQLNYFIQVDKVLDRTAVVTKTITYNLRWDATAGKWMRAQ